MNEYIARETQFSAANYQPIPVVLSRGEGAYLWDVKGRQYLDLMSAYSAVSLGHSHPRLLRALNEQAGRLAVCSRAFYTDKLGAFLERACQLTQMEKALPMNTGAEAVETALKAARKWGYQVKGIAADQAEIIVCSGNFHGRTITIVGMSSEIQYRNGFGPFPGGFKQIPFGNVQALAEAITPNTAAFLVEPIQGEAGIIVPPPGYLKRCEQLCHENNVLLICDEIQTGLGRTGKLLASQYDQVKPDGLILGKALGGGLLPVSLFLSRDEVMNVFTPGDHGSTFGGNPLASAVGLEALNVLMEENLILKSEQLGLYLINRLRSLDNPVIREVRGRGLFVGIEIDSDFATAREVCEALALHGLLSKETHETVVRIAPPLIITHGQIDTALHGIERVLNEIYQLQQARNHG